MIIVFDTYAGLCNQMFDIISAIKLMKEYSIPISFRYASFREKNLIRFYPVPFQKLFNEQPFLKEKNYVPFHSIEKDIEGNDIHIYKAKQTQQSHYTHTVYRSTLTKILRAGEKEL